jgi:hypothetical protein
MVLSPLFCFLYVSSEKVDETFLLKFAYLTTAVRKSLAVLVAARLFR